MSGSLTVILAAFSALAVCGAAAGVSMTGVPEISRRIVPLSGTVLLAISFIWILPELAEIFGWAPASLLMLGSFMLIWLVDRYISPVCPACSHTHDHDACSTRLHGFAAPLILAVAIHSLFDGWALVIGGGRALSYGVLLHKLPESIAFGVILRAALRSRASAFVWAVLAQCTTFLGAALALTVAPRVGPLWIGVLLALGGGTFLFLGFHAVHGEWKRRLAARAAPIA